MRWEQHFLGDISLSCSTVAPGGGRESIAGSRGTLIKMVPDIAAATAEHFITIQYIAKTLLDPLRMRTLDFVLLRALTGN